MIVDRVRGWVSLDPVTTRRSGPKASERRLGPVSDLRLGIPAELPEQRFGPLVAECLRNPLSQTVGIIARPDERGRDASAAVRVEDGGIEG